MTQLSNCFSFSILFRHRVTNLSLQCLSIVWHVPGTTPSPLVQVHHRFSRNERCCGSYQSLVASAGTWQGLEITTITYDNDFHFREVQQRFSRLLCLTVGQIQYRYWDLVTTGSKEGCLSQPGHQTYCYFSTQGQGGCTGFLVSMFISHLLLIKKINKQMSSYQILRIFLQFLGKYTITNLSLTMHCIFLFFIGQKYIYF